MPHIEWKPCWLTACRPGFLLGISPGGNLGFETAAFKLTKEMMGFLGGQESEAFNMFVGELRVELDCCSSACIICRREFYSNYTT
jgi:phosphatidylinositol kinase/protein kinase (PI-3  family)